MGHDSLHLVFAREGVTAVTRHTCREDVWLSMWAGLLQTARLAPVARLASVLLLRNEAMPPHFCAPALTLWPRR